MSGRRPGAPWSGPPSGPRPRRESGRERRRRGRRARPSRLRVLARLVVAAVGPFPLVPSVHAQQEGTAPALSPDGGCRQEPDLRALTLAEALETASLHNPQYRQALNDLELGPASSRQAIGAFLPSVSFSAGTQQGFTRREIAEDIFGNPIPNPDVQTAYTSGSNQGLGFRLNLFEGMGRFHELSRARSEADARTMVAAARLVTLRAEVKRRFYEAQQKTELLRVEEELLRSRERELEAIRRLFGLASKTRADVLGAEFELRLQERQVQEAESELRKTLLSLRTAMGDARLPPFRLAEAPVDIFDPTGLSDRRLVELAVTGSPRLAEERANLGVSQAQLSIARARRWPTISLNGFLGRSAYGPDQKALFEFNPRDQTSGSLSLTFDLPVFQGFTNSYAVAEASVGTQNAREALRQAELELREQVQAALIDLRNAYRAHVIQVQATEVAQERLRIAREEYRLAGRDYESLQAAIRDASDARRQELDARYGFVVARISMEEVVGARVGPASEDWP